MMGDSLIPDEAKNHTMIRARRKRAGHRTCSVGWRLGEVAREAETELQAPPLLVAEAAIPSHLPSASPFPVSSSYLPRARCCAPTVKQQQQQQL